MLFLVFQLGKDRYAIEAHQVIEVLPQVNVKQIPRAPAGVAGVFDYHGAPVPLIDLTELAVGKPSRKWMSTRIIVVKYRIPLADARGSEEPILSRDREGAVADSNAGNHTIEIHALGLLAEQATETLRRNEEDFADAGLAVSDTPYLGNVTTDSRGIVQRVEIQSLLSEGVRDQLFRERIGSE
jgi:chemotaxis-related protein WspB